MKEGAAGGNRRVQRLEVVPHGFQNGLAAVRERAERRRVIGRRERGFRIAQLDQQPRHGVLRGHGLFVDQVEGFQQGVVDADGQFRRQAQGDLVAVQRVLVALLQRTQRDLGADELLAVLLDLQVVDAAGVVEGLELFLGAAPPDHVGPLVADPHLGRHQGVNSAEAAE